MSRKEHEPIVPVECKGKEIFDIKPTVLGGNPNDDSNKVVLTRDQHKEAVRYWNKVIRQMRGSVSS